MIRINLTSDTATKPSPAMRRAMAEAAVGDEQIDQDPTTNRLIAAVCDLLGKEAAVFLPSATMANQIAMCVHGRGAEEALGHRLSHPFHYEAGGMAYLARLMPRPLEGERGMFDAEAVEAAIRPERRGREQRSRLLMVENTTNIGGGAAWPVGRIDSVLAAARRHGLSTHLDGARLMNASVASGVAPARYAEGFDSVTLCFSKGLGAPVGAALAGSREFIQEAWRFKHMLGGSMRQSGVLAAAALYALEHNVGRLAEDHANARLLAEALAELPGIRLDPGEVETNIVVFETAMDTAAEFAKRMAHEGVDFHAVGPAACRLVTHLDVSAAEIELAIARFQRVLG